VRAFVVTIVRLRASLSLPAAVERRVYTLRLAAPPSIRPREPKRRLLSRTVDRPHVINDPGPDP
jgi:hypothetical protein